MVSIYNVSTLGRHYIGQSEPKLINRLEPYPKVEATGGCVEASIVVWRLFLKAVTVARVPLALISTRIVHASETCSTPKSLRPDLVRHLKSYKKS